MLKPLFDKDCNHIGWVMPNEHIFNVNMEWMAYIAKGHVWSPHTRNWMGPINELVCLDTNGKVIAWNPECEICGSTKPVRPIRPMKPMTPRKPVKPMHPTRPRRPARPKGGWSNLTVDEWFNL